MKKSNLIIVNVCSLFVSAILIAIFSYVVKDLNSYIETKKHINDLINQLLANPGIAEEIINIHKDMLATVNQSIQTYSVWTSMLIISIIAILATLCLIDIPAIKNYMSITKEQRAQNKVAKEQQKADRAEVEKQKRIEKLQAELEELKKDE